MNDKEIHTLAAELSKSLKTPEDLNQLCAVLKKISIEAALGAELSEHLGYDSGEPRVSNNSRNGTVTRKSSQKLESLRLRLIETEKAVLSLN